MATLTVVRAGMLTTVQDLGRWGYQAEGVPVAGPMDAYSHRYANRLVGNSDGAAALEVTLIGPELEASAAVVCAVAGARFELTVNGAPEATNRAFVVPAGGRLRFGNRLAGARAALAVRGGFDFAPVFGSRATSVISRLGPFGGRPLAAGDVLPIRGSDLDLSGFGPPSERSRFDPKARAEHSSPDPGRGLRLPEGGARLRVVMGPHDAM